MPSRSQPRARKRPPRAVAGFLLAWFALGLLPPTAAAIPPTRMEAIALDATDLEPPGSPSKASADALDLRPDEWSRQRKICVPFRATMVGVTWRGADHGEAAITWAGDHRLVMGDAHEGPDPGSPEDSGIRGTPPVWTGGAGCVWLRLRSPEGEAMRGLRAVFIDTSPGAGSPLASLGFALSKGLNSVAGWWTSPASAWTTRPGIYSRNHWGGGRWRCSGSPTIMARLDVAYVHHTATGNNYSRSDVPGILRGMYNYHTNSLGYCDIAYNFLVDKFGRVFEGRQGGVTKNVMGGHAAGFNTYTVGISAVGNYSNKTPGRALIRSMRKLIAWRLDLAHVRPGAKATLTSQASKGSTSKYPSGTRVTMRRVVGHRRTSYTGCPGDSLAAKVAGIRNWADRNGHPKIYNPKQSRQDVVVGTSSVRLRASASREPRWYIDIYDPEGDRVRRFSAVGSSIDRTWDGRTSSGVLLPDGTYRVKIWAKKGDRLARSAWLSVNVCAVGDPTTGNCPST